MNNRLIIIGVVLLAALYVFFSSIYVVNERDQAIVGQPAQTSQQSGPSVGGR